jgi:hypothetical protein
LQQGFKFSPQLYEIVVKLNSVIKVIDVKRIETKLSEIRNSDIVESIARKMMESEDNTILAGDFNSDINNVSQDEKSSLPGGLNSVYVKFTAEQFRKKKMEFIKERFSKDYETYEEVMDIQQGHNQEPGVDSVQPDDSSKDYLDQFRFLNEKFDHPLDRYKALLAVFDIEPLKDDHNNFIIINKQSGRPFVFGGDVSALRNDLLFAKSWLTACGKDLSMSGEKNEFGVDARQWEYAFNEGAKDTFDQICQVMTMNDQSKLGQKIKDYVASNSNYKYSNSIVNHLLSRSNVPVINSIFYTLQSEALKLNKENAFDVKDFDLDYVLD